LLQLGLWLLEFFPPVYEKLQLHLYLLWQMYQSRIILLVRTTAERGYLQQRLDEPNLVEISGSTKRKTKAIWFWSFMQGPKV
jgi:hypothetical protein